MNEICKPGRNFEMRQCVLFFNTTQTKFWKKEGRYHGHGS